MAQLAPSYYVSAVQGKGTTGTLAGLTVYPFSDVSIFSTDASPVKTVAADDVVALLDDGSYSLVKHLALPSASAASFTVLRGAKSTDGSFDSSRATRPQITLGAYRVNGSTARQVLADLYLTGPTGSVSALVTVAGTANDYNLLYNLRIEKGAGSSNDNGISTPSAAAIECGIIGCKVSVGGSGIVISGTAATGLRILYNEIVNCTQTGISGPLPAGAHLWHNVVSGCLEGIYTGAGMGANSSMLHNTVKDCLSGDGFDITTGSGCMIVGNLAAGNGQYGFRIANNVANLICSGNAGYNNVSGTSTVTGTFGHPVEEFHTLSALTFATHTPTAATGMPSLGSLIQGEVSGRNYAGALTQFGASATATARWPLPRGHNF